MADNTPVKGSFTKKIAPSSIAGMLLGLIVYLPQPYAHWLALFVSCLYFLSLIATQIPAPTSGSKWAIPYKLLCLLSANFGASSNDDATPDSPSNAQATAPKQVVIISSSEDVVKATQQALSNKDISIMDTVNQTQTTTTPATPSAPAPQAAQDTAPVQSTVKKESITDLVAAGEALYETISGKKSDDAVKVISGVSSIADVLLPALDAKVNVRIEDIIGGTTGVLGGVDAIIGAFKKQG